MTWIWGILGAFVLLVAIVFGVGATLPQNHVASRTVQLPQSQGEVWAAITDVARYPEWRSNVKSVDMLPPPSDGTLAWRENDGRESLSYAATESVAPMHFVTRITDIGKPFGGSWTFNLAPSNNGGTTLTITEHGEVYNPIFRFVSRFVMGHTHTIDVYVTDLTEHLRVSGAHTAV